MTISAYKLELYLPSLKIWTVEEWSPQLTAHFFIVSLSYVLQSYKQEME